MGESVNPVAEFQALDSFGRTPLHIAAEKGDLAEIKRLLDKGLDPNAVDKEHNTPLMAAVESNRANPEVVKLLLSRGANVKATDGNGGTALHHAAASSQFNDNDRKQVVEALIAGGAEVNAKDVSGRTPLHEAASWGHTETAATLVEKGADPNARGNEGVTPMHLAASNQNITTETMVMLAEKGGSLSAKNSTGQTPVEVYKDNHSPKETEKAIEEFKAALVKRIKSASLGDKSQAYQDLASLGPAQGNAMVASNDKPSVKGLSAIPNMQTSRGEGRG